MSLVTFLCFLLITAFSWSAQGLETFPATPLASKHFSYPTGIPYQVDTDSLARGTQYGYNICNSTTEGPGSLCQTAIFNEVDDFCLWAPSSPGSIIGNTQGDVVAWCSKEGHGARSIPKNAITGLQFLKTPDYIQIVGFMDQTKMDMVKDDIGGQMDPHGADLRGNPIGGIMFSNAFGGSYEQVVEWTNIMGANIFCTKACDPSGPNAAKYCQHTYDRIGCQYNMPSNAVDGVFEACDADNSDFPGVYTAGSQVLTYTQPPESLGPITTMPYAPRLPASSNCRTFSSAALFVATSAPVPTSSGGSSRGTDYSGPTATGTSATFQAVRKTGRQIALIAGIVAAIVLLLVVVGGVLVWRRRRRNVAGFVRSPPFEKVDHGDGADERSCSQDGRASPQSPRRMTSLSRQDGADRY